MAFELAGNLQQDALGLWQLLRMALKKEDLLYLEGLYTYLSKAGLAKEECLSRSEGAPYNPRPARVARLLFDALSQDAAVSLTSASHEALVEALGGALILGCYGIPTRPTDHALGEIWEKSFELAELARLRLTHRPQHEETLSIVATLAAARLLDDARHLHQRGLPPDRIREEANRTLALVSELRELQAHPQTLLLTESALEKLLRRRENLSA